MVNVGQALVETFAQSQGLKAGWQLIPVLVVVHCDSVGAGRAIAERIANAVRRPVQCKMAQDQTLKVMTCS